MHRSVHIGYRVRVVAYGYFLFVIGLQLLERSVGALAYGLLVLQCLVFPQLAYLRARRAADPKAAELANVYVGTVLLGAWTAGLGFPTWIAYAACSAAALTGAVTQGVVGVAYAITLYIFGVLAWIVPFGLEYRPSTSGLVTALCFLGALGFATLIGCMAYNLRRALRGLAHLERRRHDRLMGPFDPGGKA
jgi:hypothetical protein